MIDKTSTAISEFAEDQVQADLGLLADRMPEAEVALRLAEFILSLPGSGAMASVAIDGASIKVGEAIVFDIGQFMAGTGWEQVKEPQVGRNAWIGTYRRGDKTIRVHSRPGEGDVVATVGGRRIVAECKKGPLARRPGSPDYPLLTAALGQALLFDVSADDIVIAAVPDTPVFRRLAEAWRKRPLVRRAGIRIVPTRSRRPPRTRAKRLAKRPALRRQLIATSFGGLRRDIDEPPVPVAPARAFPRRGSATDGAARVVGDDVAALPHADLEQFRALAGVGLLHDGHLLHDRLDQRKSRVATRMARACSRSGTSAAGASTVSFGPSRRRSRVPIFVSSPRP